MLRKYLLFFFFLIFAQLEFFAVSIAFACFQNSDAHEKCIEITSEFEELLFEACFDKGIIATSMPIGIIKSKEKIALADIKRIFDEPTDYVLICSFEYGKDYVYDGKFGAKIPNWKNLTVLLMDVSSEKEVCSFVFDEKKIKKTEFKKRTVEFSKEISKEIFEVILNQNNKAEER